MSFPLLLCVRGVTSLEKFKMIWKVKEHILLCTVGGVLTWIERAWSQSGLCQTSYRCWCVGLQELRLQGLMCQPDGWVDLHTNCFPFNGFGSYLISFWMWGCSANTALRGGRRSALRDAPCASKGTDKHWVKTAEGCWLDVTFRKSTIKIKPKEPFSAFWTKKESFWVVLWA